MMMSRRGGGCRRTDLVLFLLFAVFFVFNFASMLLKDFFTSHLKISRRFPSPKLLYYSRCIYKRAR